MKFIKKYSLFFIAFAILAIFFFTRFYNILSLPIFTDEAIHIRWSQIAKDDATWRFISLTDGKQPMYVWIAMILMRFIHDPLLAGRAVSVIAGLVSTIGIFFLTYEIFKNKKIALLSSFIYVIYPFALVYDRMALYDSLVAMFIIWALYFEILLVRYVRLDLAMILGAIVGLGMLTKTNADFALILLPFSLLLFNFKDKKWKHKLKFWLIYAVVVAFIAASFYSILRLSPFYHIIDEKNLVFIYSFSDWIYQPFAFLMGNLRAMNDWLVTYMTAPFLVLVVAAFFVGRKYLREKLLLLIWFVVPFFALAFFGKVIYPRFLLFMTIPLLVLGTYALYSLVVSAKRKWLQVFTVVVFLILFVINDFFILTNFNHAGIPDTDKGQFIRGWPAGTGVNETVAFLKERSAHQKIYVATAGTFGLMPYALEIYLHDNPNIIIKGFWPVNETPPADLTAISKKMPTYVVFYQPCMSCKQIGDTPPLWPVKQILRIKKADQSSYYTLYQLK